MAARVGGGAAVRCVLKREVTAGQVRCIASRGAYVCAGARHTRPGVLAARSCDKTAAFV